MSERTVDFRTEWLCGAGVLRGLRSRSGFTSVEVFRKYLVSHDPDPAVCSQYHIGLSLSSMSVFKHLVPCSGCLTRLLSYRIVPCCSTKCNS